MPPGEKPTLQLHEQVLSPKIQPVKGRNPPGFSEQPLIRGLDAVLAAKKPTVHADLTVAALAKKEEPKLPQTLPPDVQIRQVATEIGRLSDIAALSTTPEAERAEINRKLADLQDQLAQLGRKVAGVKKDESVAGKTQDRQEESTTEGRGEAGSDTKAVEEKKDSHEADTLMHRSNEQIKRLTRLIQGGKVPAEKLPRAKAILEQKLAEREKLFHAVLSAVRPDIQEVAGNPHVYRAGESVHVYGSIYTVMDVGERVFAHQGLAERMKYQASGASTLPGESFLESSVVFSGSSAQDRVNPYGGDIDMAEHMRVKANSKEEAGAIIADSIRSTVNENFPIDDGKGNQMELHFYRLKAGTYPEDGKDVKARGKSLSWTFQEIQDKQKVIELANGKEKVITLSQACEEPGFFKLDYYGQTATVKDGVADGSNGQVIEVTKTTSVIAVNGKNESEVFIDNYPKPTQAVAFQEVYFSEPTPEYGLVDKVANADGYIGYVGLMKDQIWHYSEPDNYNGMKVAKRMYNLLRTEGDIALSQDLAAVFQTPAAQINQLVDRLGAAQIIADKGVDVTVQRESMKNKLASLLTASSEPEAAQVLNLISSGDVQLGEKSEVSALVRKIVDRQVNNFFESNPRLAQRLQEIRAEKPAGETGAH